MVRVKQRYILGELVFENQSKGAANQIDRVYAMPQKELQLALKQQLQVHFGEVGYAALSMNFLLKFWNP